MTARLPSTAGGKAGGKASADQQFDRLYNLYNVHKNVHVCKADFDFVHGLARQFVGGPRSALCTASLSVCKLPPLTNSSNNGSLPVADGVTGKKWSAGMQSALKGNTGKAGVMQESFSEEFGKAAFGNVDLDSDGSIGWKEFRDWLTALIQCGNDQRRPLVLIQHVTHMLQADKRYTAYRSLALAAKRAQQQQDSRQMFVATSAFLEALGSAERVIKDDDILVQFRSELAMRQEELKRKLFSSMASAETLQARERALQEVTDAKGILLLEPTELRELKRYKEMVKASSQPFTVHVSTIAGPEAHIEASAEDSVWSLRLKVNAELKQGRHAYQTQLSSERGPLKNDSATLRESLLCLSEGEELMATYTKADRWVELSHPEFQDFRRKEANESVRLHRAAEEAESKARFHKSESNKIDVLVRKAEACCHKTWEQTTLEDILIETTAAYSREYGRRWRALKRMVRALKRRGLVED